ncbi:hypothetical protein [Jiella endophytica]|uniref:hypothetical protein n=1 Tax=Jiella endophytica TaxID=2558362 RepID=UPI0014320DDA|nr:hypothetical protein [Jiella endophytica]
MTGVNAFKETITRARLAARKRRGALRAVMALLLAGAMAASSLEAARAAGADDTLDLIEARLRDTVADVLTRNCIGLKEPRPFTVTFYGLPIGDPHFTQNDRQRVNDLVLRGLREARRVAVDVSAAADAGALAPISGLGTQDQNQLATALSRLGSSTLPIVLKATRPEPGVARIDMSVFARGADGAYGCNRSIAFNLALDTLEPMADSRSPRDYLTLEGAYRAALDTLAPRLKSLPGVYLKSSADPGCAYLDRAAERFQDAYYGADQLNVSSGLAGRNLPDLLLGEPAEGDETAILDLAFTVPSQPADTLDILASLRSKGRLLSRQRFSVAAESGEFDACRMVPEAVNEPQPDTVDTPDPTPTASNGEGTPALGLSETPPEVVDPDGAENGVSTDPTPRADGTIPTVPVPVEPDAGPDEPSSELAGLPDAPQPEPIAVPEPVAPSCREEGQILDFSVGPTTGRTGDRLSLRALVRQCTPSFFAFASGKVTPIPVRIFEKSETASGATAYESSPKTKAKLYLEEADPLGLNKVVLFCSSCVVEPQKQDLVGWLGGIRGELSSERRAAAATLPGGVGYAFGSVEKLQ